VNTAQTISGVASSNRKARTHRADKQANASLCSATSTRSNAADCTWPLHVMQSMCCGWIQIQHSAAMHNSHKPAPGAAVHERASRSRQQNDRADQARHVAGHDHDTHCTKRMAHAVSHHTGGKELTSTQIVQGTKYRCSPQAKQFQARRASQTSQLRLHALHMSRTCTTAAQCDAALQRLKKTSL